MSFSEALVNSMEGKKTMKNGENIKPRHGTVRNTLSRCAMKHYGVATTVRESGHVLDRTRWEMVRYVACVAAGLSRVEMLLRRDRNQ